MPLNANENASYAAFVGKLNVLIDIRFNNISAVITASYTPPFAVKVKSVSVALSNLLKIALLPFVSPV